MPDEIIEHETILMPEPAWTPGDVLYFGSESRSIALYGDVNRSSSLVLISQILELESRSHKPIKIHLNTDGGALSDALAIYDCLRGIRSPVIIIATGVCASAGLLILSAGDLRVATKHTLFFYHQAILPSEAFTSRDQIASTNEAYNLCQKRYDKILGQRSTLSKTEYAQEFEGKVSKYFTSKDALQYGLIDGILEPQQKAGKIVLEEENG